LNKESEAEIEDKESHPELKASSGHSMNVSRQELFQQTTSRFYGFAMDGLPVANPGWQRSFRIFLPEGQQVTLSFSQ